MSEVSCSYRRGAEAAPSAPALSKGDDVLTYAEVDRLINRVAYRLQQRFEIASGDCVGLLPSTSSASIISIFALQRLGALTALLNSRLTSEVMQRQLKAADARLVLLDAPQANLDGISCQSLLEGDDAETEPVLPATLKRSSEASIIFTSGSTGIGKGVVLSVGNHFSSAEAANTCNSLSTSSKWLLSLPLYHVGGLEILYRTSIAGAEAVLTVNNTPAELAEEIRSKEITHISLVPVMLSDMIEYDVQCLKSLEFIMLGGAPTGRRLLEAIEEHRLPVRTSYGMTETTSHISLLRPEHGIAKIATSGSPLPHCEVRIVDEKDQSCATGQIGRVLVRGESIARRYLDQATVDDEGWFATRDLGSFDEQGCLIIHGREDDVIISGGENISLPEIVAAAESAPGVSVCAAIGVSDERWGQRPLLFVEADSEDLLPELEAVLRDKLPGYKRPDRIIVLEQFPRTPVGKIDYPALRKIAV